MFADSVWFVFIFDSWLLWSKELPVTKIRFILTSSSNKYRGASHDIIYRITVYLKVNLFRYMVYLGSHINMGCYQEMWFLHQKFNVEQRSDMFPLAAGPSLKTVSRSTDTETFHINKGRRRTHTHICTDLYYYCYYYIYASIYVSIVMLCC